MSTLHITNGDCAADTLRLIVTDPVTIMADVLHEGPCPAVDGDAWHDVRGRFLGSYGYPPDEVKASLAAGDRTVVDACRRGAGIVLWFEHDLFDQLALIRTLDLIVRLEPDTDTTDTPFAVESGSSRTLPRVTMICIGSFPGIDRFIGLGQLTADQMATLKGTGVPVTAGHFRLATDAWRAFRSPDPAELLDLTLRLSAAQTAISEGGPALPFLGEALLRFFAEYPSASNGLSRTEELALQALGAGPTTAGALFGVTQDSEPRPFMGDLQFFEALQRLASARVPLVTSARPHEAIAVGDLISITDAGRDVLARRADHLRLNGIDRWRGGVHLAGTTNSPWRWDAGSETLVS